jgi:hypothetical protein
MDNRKKTKRKDQPQAPEQGRNMSESSPNPHGEAKVIEMPIRTDHGKRTTENVPRSTSTVENRMNPSVGEHISGAPHAGNAIDSDSMFNNADPQGHDPEKSGGSGNKKKNRKMA